MAGALMNKVWNLFGMDSAEPEEYEDEEDLVKFSILIPKKKKMKKIRSKMFL